MHRKREVLYNENGPILSVQTIYILINKSSSIPKSLDHAARVSLTTFVKIGIGNETLFYVLLMNPDLVSEVIVAISNGVIKNLCYWLCRLLPMFVKEQ